MSYVLGHRRTDRPLWRKLPRLTRFVAKLAFAQERLLFQPSRDLRPGPEGFEPVAVALPDGVDGRLADPPPGQAAPGVALLYVPGAIGNLSHDLPSLAFLTSLGFRVLAYDHPGFGRSSGRPTLAKSRAAARRAWNHLGSLPEVERIVLFGRSFGGTIVAELARDHAQDPRLGGMVLLDTFSSVPDMARRHLPSWLVSLGCRVKLDAAAAVGIADVPTLVLHAEHDEVIPQVYGRRLFEAARGPKRWLSVPGGHFDPDWRYDPRTRLALLELAEGRARAWPRTADR